MKRARRRRPTRPGQRAVEALLVLVFPEGRKIADAVGDTVIVLLAVDHQLAEPAEILVVFPAVLRLGSVAGQAHQLIFVLDMLTHAVDQS